jgi:Rab5 GDP/GTP exchange factor
MNAEDAAALQASAEVEQARKLQRQEHQVVVETLLGMFPNLDREVIDDVVRMKEGRYVDIDDFDPNESYRANEYTGLVLQ